MVLANPAAAVLGGGSADGGTLEAVFPGESMQGVRRALERASPGEVSEELEPRRLFAADLTPQVLLGSVYFEPATGDDSQPNRSCAEHDCGLGGCQVESGSPSEVFAYRLPAVVAA